MNAPSAAAGIRRTSGLHRLVVAVWLLSMAAFAPVQGVVLAMTGPARAALPEGGLARGEALVVFFELLRPAVIPVAVALCCGAFLFLAWSVLWHAGCVRWWLDSDADEASVVSVVTAGLRVWWCYARLAVVVLTLQAAALVVPWLPLRAGLEERFLMPALIGGAVLAFVGSVLVWLGGLRGAWRLGESGRRSALVAWCRGLWVSLREPLRSVLPLLVWGVLGIALLLLPLALDGPWVPLILLVAWLAAACCWVALHMSYAPPRALPSPPPETRDKPTGTPYVTTRFPTLHSDR